MKILLTGASGQLGREWQHGLARREQANLDLVSYTSSQLDITRFKEVEHEIEQQQPDLIINCAAYTKVDEAEEEREKAMRVNAESVRNLADLSNRFDIKLVHFSTDYIFPGQKEDHRQFPEGYPEDHEADPINWYGQTKWGGEEAIRASGCRHLIMRVSWLCGVHGSNFVKTMLRLSNTREQLDVVEDQFGSPTFTDHLVQQTLILIEENKIGTYHLTSKGLICWADFAELIFEKTAKNVHVNRIPSEAYPVKAKRPFFSKLSTKKIEEIDGVNIEPWETGVSRLLENLKKAGF